LPRRSLCRDRDTTGDTPTETEPATGDRSKLAQTRSGDQGADFLKRVVSG
jgi:hypothetical protein